MATDATGAPTPLGIPKYNTSADAPSGLGFNAAMDAIDALIAGKISKPVGISSGEAAVWNGSSWDRSTVTKLGVGSISGGVGLQLIDDFTVTGSVLATYDTNTRLGGNIPASYKDLVLSVKGKSDQAAAVNLLGRVNNVSSATYYWQDIFGAAAAATETEGIGDTTLRLGYLPRSAGLVTAAEITVANYTDPNFFPTLRSAYLAALDNGSGSVRSGQAGGAQSTAGSTTRLQLFLSAGNFAIGTRFTLYGRN